MTSCAHCLYGDPIGTEFREFLKLPKGLKYFIVFARAEGETKLFPISRSWVNKIIAEIDPRIVGSHWFRHQRLSHLAEALNPYQLVERIGFWEGLDPAVSYVHGRISDYLKAVEQARESELKAIYLDNLRAHR